MQSLCEGAVAHVCDWLNIAELTRFAITCKHLRQFYPAERIKYLNNEIINITAENQRFEKENTTLKEQFEKIHIAITKLEIV